MFTGDKNKVDHTKILYKLFTLLLWLTVLPSLWQFTVQSRSD